MYTTRKKNSNEYGKEIDGGRGRGGGRGAARGMNVKCKANFKLYHRVRKYETKGEKSKDKKYIQEGDG